MFIKTLFMIIAFSSAMAYQSSGHASQKSPTLNNSSSQKSQRVAPTQKQTSKTSSSSASTSKKAEVDDQKTNRDRSRILVSLHEGTVLSQALGFLSKFYDECQPISGRDSQSGEIECLARCQSDQNAVMDPRASGGSGRSMTVFSKCNGKECLLISYSKREDGSLNIHHGGFHPDNTDGPPGLGGKIASLSKSINDATARRKAWEKDCSGATNCIIDADGHGTPHDGTFCDGSSACFGMNGGSYTLFLDAEGEMNSCSGLGCADFDELEAAHEWQKAAEQAEAEDDDVADVVGDDNPDDPEDEDCSRVAGGDAGECAHVTGIELAAYEFFKQKAIRERLAIKGPSAVDPNPEGGQLHFRTRLSGCPGKNPRQGPREKPREDQRRCQSYEVSINTEGEDENCKDGKISPEEGKPKGRKGRPTSQGGGRVDPRPF